MTICFLFICMLFCHIVDDYYLQGVLASMKQRHWWEENSPDPLYKHDYIVALVMHSASWTFMIMLPLLIKQGFYRSWLYIIFFVINTITHCATDNLKANEQAINLVVDQSIHIIQIIATLVVFRLGGIV